MDSLLSVDHFLRRVLALSSQGFVCEEEQRSITELAGVLDGSWFSGIFDSYSARARSYLSEIGGELSLEKVSDHPLPTLLSTNGQVINIFSKVISSKPLMTKLALSDLALAERSNLVRNSNVLHPSDSLRDLYKDDGTKDIFIYLISLADELDSLRDRSVIERRAGGVSEDVGDYLSKPSGEIAVRVISHFVFLRLPGHPDRLMSPQGFHRLTHLMRTVANFTLGLSHMTLNDTPSIFLTRLFTKLNEVSIRRPEFLGECLKGAKSILIIRCSGGHVSLNPEEDYLSEISEERAKYAIELAEIIGDQFHSKIDAQNAANLYKCLPHPDTNMFKVFDSVKKLQEPRPFDESMSTLFEGTLRKMIHSALQKLHIPPRLVATQQVGEKLARASSDSQRSLVGDVLSWASTKFELDKKITPPRDIEVGVFDKASSSGARLTRSEIELLLSSPTKVGKTLENKLKNINDIYADSIGNNELDISSAVEEFNHLIKRFEEMEAGRCPEDIPLSELQNFLLDNTDLINLVTTEPKYGEFHKENTRLFYILPQRLKALTQRVERLTKQICYHQSGSSITQSHERNSIDLKAFADSYSDGTETSSVYVSFDLNEFSKRYPTKLLRIYGKVLSELTGEDWLKRIDLVFKSSIVVSSTRGFYGCLVGVLGCFEGIFNYVWTSSHSIVAQISLTSINLFGKYVTFSDDALLQFNVVKDAPRKLILLAIDKIEEIYQKSGLSFNRKKMLISMQSWEYLGRICVKGRITAQWVKELGSYGRNLRTRALTTRHNVIQQLISQSRALVKSGYSSTSAYVLMHFYTTRVLRRMLPKLDPITLESLYITPWNCNGIRLPSAMEMLASSGVERDEEYLADLHIYSTEVSEVAFKSIGMVMENFADKDSDVDALILGTRFKVKRPVTSGDGVVSNAIDMINERASKSLKTNPIDDNVRKKLRRLLANYKNFDPNMVSAFLMNLNVFEEYTLSKAFATSQGATKFLKKKELSRLQRRDTTLFREALLTWYNFEVKTESVKDLINYSRTKFLKCFDMLPPSKSFRVICKRSLKTPTNGITVTFDPFDRGKNHPDTLHREPHPRTTLGVTTVGWLSQSGSVGGVRNSRKLMDMISSYVSYYPSAYPLFVGLGAIFKVVIPRVPGKYLSNPHRPQMTSRRAYNYFLPSLFCASTRYRYIGEIHDIVERRGSNKTMYGEFARAAASIVYDLTTYQSDTINSLRQFHFQMTPFFDVRDINPPSLRQITITPHYIGRVDASEDYDHQMVLAMDERLNLMKYEDAIERLDSGEFNFGDNILSRSCRRLVLKTFISVGLRGENKCSLPYEGLSENLSTRSSDMKHAILVAAYESLEPRDRVSISSVLLKPEVIKQVEALRLPDDVNLFNYLVEEGEDQPDFLPYKESTPREAKVAGVSIEVVENYPKKQDEQLSIGRLISRVSSIIDMIKPVSPLLLGGEDFLCLREYSPREYSPLIEHLLDESFLRESNIIIIRDSTAKPGKVSRGMALSVKRAVSNTIRVLYSYLARNRWDTVAFRARFPSFGDPDLVLNFLATYGAHAYRSDHREQSTVSNENMLAAQLMKFYFLLQRPGDSELFDCDSAERIISHFAAMPDVVRVLRDELPPQVVARLRVCKKSGVKPIIFRNLLEAYKHIRYMANKFASPYLRQCAQLPSQLVEEFAKRGLPESPLDVSDKNPVALSHFTGELMDDYSDVTDVIKPLLVVYRNRNGLNGYSYSGPFQREIALSKTVCDGGENIRAGPGAGLRLIMLKHTSASEAAANYAYSLSRVTSMTVTIMIKSRDYRTILIDIGRNIVPSEFPYASHDIEWESAYKRHTIHGAQNMLEERAERLLMPRNPRFLSQTFNIESYLSNVRHSHGEILSETKLCAAHHILLHQENVSAKVWAYREFYRHIMGKDVKITSLSEAEAEVIDREVSRLRQWLICSGISSFPIDPGGTMKLVESLLTLKTMKALRKLTQDVTFLTPVSFKEACAFSLGGPGETNILSKVIYRDVTAIEPEEPTIDDDEEPDFDGIHFAPIAESKKELE